MVGDCIIVLCPWQHSPVMKSGLERGFRIQGLGCFLEGTPFSVVRLWYFLAVTCVPSGAVLHMCWQCGCLRVPDVVPSTWVVDNSFIGAPQCIPSLLVPECGTARRQALDDLPLLVNGQIVHVSTELCNNLILNHWSSLCSASGGEWGICIGYPIRISWGGWRCLSFAMLCIHINAAAMHLTTSVLFLPSWFACQVRVPSFYCTTWLRMVGAV